MIRHRTARWRNVAGTTEEVRFLGAPGRRIYGVTHLPAGHVRGALVICSPVLLEQMRNYRREVVLARTLSERRFAVQRFHYRGTGQSDGDSRDVSLLSMAEDALTAAARLSTAAGTDRIGFLGTRVGGPVAARAAARWPTEPLVLWEPVLSVRGYVTELCRAQLVGALKQSDGATTPEDPRTVLNDRGTVEILGFELTSTLIDSLETLDLEAALAEHSGPVLLAESNPRGQLRRAYAELTDRLAHGGRAIETLVVRDDAAGWWFPGSLSSTETADQALTGATVTWLAELLRAEVAG